MVSLTKLSVYLFLLCVGFSFLSAGSSGFRNEPSSTRYAINAFKKLLATLNITSGSYIPKDSLVHLLKKITGKYVCPSETPCSNALCLSADDLINLSTGRTSKQKLYEDEFSKVAVILLYRLMNETEMCKAPPNFSYSDYETQLISSLTDDQRMISSSKLDDVLHGLTGTTHQDDHKSHHDHDHDHDRKRRSVRSDREEDQRQNSKKEHQRGGSHGSTFAALQSDPHHEHDHHDDHEDHDDHDEDHADEIELPSLYKSKCFNAELVIDQSKTEERGNHSSEIRRIASVIIYHLYNGTNFDDSCRILPTRTAFLKSLFQNFNAVNGSLSLVGFEDIVKKLNIGSSKDEEADGHDHGHHKRSLYKRKKRALDQSAKSSGKIDKCFSALELLAVFSNKPKSTIASEVFMDICPALVQQHVSGACKYKAKVNQKASPAKRYGYGTICVFVICLCSVVGALVIVCKNRPAFIYIMGMFEGLAVGTLTSDAMLHLIPDALGLHQHGSEPHGEEENGGPNYIWFCLVCLGGIYIFYLLEVLLTWFNEGHGHSHNFAESEGNIPEVYTVSESKSDEKVNSQMNIVEVKSEIKRRYKITPLALMVVIGDALHNFADGLAIGAAFNQSLVVGFATSLAVFCHELPHELGDFGVLLASGIGYKRAIFFNLFSSLTAFIGLYIGLGIATDHAVRQWIFAITSGMFLYIALVDLLPHLKSSELKNSKGLLFFCNLGILIGVILMLLIGLYEDEITFT